MNIIRKFFDRIEKITEKIGMILLTLMILIIGGQVILRYIFKFTPRWSEELALVFMIWFSFLGMAIGVKKGIHISIEYFMNLLPLKIKKYINILDEIIIIFFGGVLLIKGYELSEMMLMSRMPSLGVPTTVQYAVVPIAGFLMIVYSCFNLIDRLNNKKIEGEDIL